VAKSVREPIGIVCSSKPLASADGTGGVSNDSGPQFKHSFLGQRAEKLSDNRLWRCGRQ
jgi:hypothetical protein